MIVFVQGSCRPKIVRASDAAVKLILIHSIGISENMTDWKAKFDSVVKDTENSLQNVKVLV